jgi:ABC-type ATPase with predicted acetyltransferase domain
VAYKPRQPTESEKYRYLDEHEAIIKKIEGGSALSIFERQFVAEVLQQYLMPKRELRARYRQLRLGEIEVLKRGAKRARKQSKISADDWADYVAKGLGFQSAKAMEKFVTRARKEKPDN